MAKAKKFKLTYHEPFVFDGANGEHVIPQLEKIPYEQWKDIGALGMKTETDPGALLSAYRDFFISVCPELADEEIGDNQWMQLGNAYFEAMGE